MDGEAKASDRASSAVAILRQLCEALPTRFAKFARRFSEQASGLHFSEVISSQVYGSESTRGSDVIGAVIEFKSAMGGTPRRRFTRCEEGIKADVIRIWVVLDDHRRIVGFCGINKHLFLAEETPKALAKKALSSGVGLRRRSALQVVEFLSADRSICWRRSTPITPPPRVKGSAGMVLALRLYAVANIFKLYV